jgi:hypothetical protein
LLFYATQIGAVIPAVAILASLAPARIGRIDGHARQPQILEWARPGAAKPNGRCPTFSGTKADPSRRLLAVETRPEMHEIIYLIGLVVVVMFVLSLLGLR